MRRGEAREPPHHPSTIRHSRAHAQRRAFRALSATIAVVSHSVAPPARPYGLRNYSNRRPARVELFHTYTDREPCTAPRAPPSGQRSGLDFAVRQPHELPVRCGAPPVELTVFQVASAAGRPRQHGASSKNRSAFHAASILATGSRQISEASRRCTCVRALPGSASLTAECCGGRSRGASACLGGCGDASPPRVLPSSCAASARRNPPNGVIVPLSFRSHAASTTARPGCT